MRIELVMEWIKKDFEKNSFRFLCEVFAWSLSVLCALILALTVPKPPLLILYIIWITSSFIFMITTWSRNSFGLFGNYILLCMIDIFGLVRLLKDY